MESHSVSVRFGADIPADVFFEVKSRHYMDMKYCLAVSTALLAIALLDPVPAQAHHAVSAKFDTSETLTLTGSVTQIDWSSPHVHVFMNVGSGESVVNWAIELESPADLGRAGWQPDSLAVGDVITVGGPPARDSSRQAWADQIVRDSTGDQVFTGRSTAPPLRTDRRPTPRWPNGSVRLSPDDGGLGYWAGPSVSSLIEEGAEVGMDAYGLLSDLSEAGDVAPFQPWALAVYRDRQENFLAEDPGFQLCLPPGGPRQFMTPQGVQFIEDPVRDRMFVLLGSGNHHWRMVYMDDREQVGEQGGDADNPLYYGRSIGRWDDDTLIVDSIGFNERFWMSNGGLPHTDRLRLTERFTRIDYDTLQYEVTIDDPGAYSRPWTSSWTLSLVRDEKLPEYYCQDNRP
jgi:hypothetical protein